MRNCDGCTLCCKLPRIPAISKPSNQWCAYCRNGCSIHDHKPQVCREFNCWWLAGAGDEQERPDRAHFYISGNAGDDALKVLVDSDYPDAWRASQLLERFRGRGFHLIVVVDKSLTFLPGKGRVMPEKLVVEWLL